MRLFNLVLLVTVLLPVPGRAQTRTNLINGILAIVNDAIITYQEVDLATAPIMAGLLDKHRNDRETFFRKQDEVWKEGLEQLVQRQLILEDFKANGGALPESIIEDTIKERMREKLSDRGKLIQELQAEGMTYETYRQHTRDKIIIDYMRAKNVSGEKILISPARIEGFYQTNQTRFEVDEQVKLRVITFNKIGGEADPAARNRAEEVRKKILEGAKFADMAGVYSEGGQRKEGGLWGWVDRKTLQEDLRDIVFSLKSGECSPVIDAKEGYHLILVEERQPTHVRPLPEVRDEIERELIANARARLEERWLKRIEKKALIRYF